MTKPIRTFVSVSVPVSPALDRLFGKIDRMGHAFRLVRRNQMHITLKFLGDTSPHIVPDITRVIEDVLQDRKPFEMKLEGVGVFPDPQRPTVFWVGVTETEAFISLANNLEQRLEELGFSPEQRTFSPHLTIARIRKNPPVEFFKLLETMKNSSFGSVVVNQILLMQSQLSSDGPEYFPLAAIPLA